MISKQLISDSIEFAYSEIDKFGLPTRLHFDLSLQKGKEIAEKLGANEDLVSVGICLMDIKLGDAFAQKRLSEHVQMGVETSKQFLASYKLTNDEFSGIINCVAAHHGTIPFSCKESEIVANADCYRFIHPKGVLEYIGTVSKRNLTYTETLKQVESKLDEKMAILSLGYCQEELNDYYSWFKKMISEAIR